MKKSVSVFLKSFVISFLILSSLSGVLLYVFVAGQEAEQEEPTTQYIYPTTEEEDITLLFTLSRRRGETADHFLLMKLSPVDNAVICTQMPEKMKATVNITTGTLSELYDYGGAEMVIRAVENVFSLKVDRYVRLDDAALIQVVDKLGGMEYQVEEEYRYTDADGLEMVVQPGRQWIDGRRFLTMIRSGKVDAGMLTAQLMAQQWGQGLAQRLDSCFQTLVNLADSNINVLDYEYRKESFLQMLEQENRFYSGRLSGSQQEGRWIPDSSCKSRISSLYQ